MCNGLAQLQLQKISSWYALSTPAGRRVTAAWRSNQCSCRQGALGLWKMQCYTTLVAISEMCNPGHLLSCQDTQAYLPDAARHQMCSSWISHTQALTQSQQTPLPAVSNTLVVYSRAAGGLGWIIMTTASAGKAMQGTPADHEMSWL